ncbi:MAG: hypothetical protein QXW55_04330 [Candidatus Bathyarchaeia archaeon]
MELRRQVAVAFKEELEPDTGVDQPVTQIEYMRVYERYCGNLYRRIAKVPGRNSIILKILPLPSIF